MNCYTLEASFFGFFDKERETKEFMHSHLFRVGRLLANTLFEYTVLREEELRQQKEIRARREEEKKAKAKAMGAVIVKEAKENHKEAKNKEDTTIIKVREGSQGAGARAVMSPSASSEAVTNIDDQQPDLASNKKINMIRKKLQHAQQNKKDKQNTINETGGTGQDTAGARNALGVKTSAQKQKKKFKVIKKFKDDMVPNENNQDDDQGENKE